MPIEAHRDRIESDHNEGLPKEQWEGMEAIIDGFMGQFQNLKLCAGAYELDPKELRAWIQSRKPKGLTMRIYTEAVVNRDALRMRINRGMDIAEATMRPVMSKTERGKKAILSRWNKEY